MLDLWRFLFFHIHKSYCFNWNLLEFSLIYSWVFWTAYRNGSFSQFIQKKKSFSIQLLLSVNIQTQTFRKSLRLKCSKPARCYARCWFLFHLQWFGTVTGKMNPQIFVTILLKYVYTFISQSDYTLFSILFFLFCFLFVCLRQF